MLRLSRTDAWVVRRLLAGMESDGLTGGTSAGLRRLVEHLAGLPIYSRLVAWVAFTASLPEPEAAAAVQAVADADPGQPIPDDQPAAFATLEDVARVSTGAKWLWEGWIPTGSVCAAAATEGCGKTRTMLDWCRRMYLGEDWPDGQPASVPVGTRSLWLCADGHQSELATTATDFGLDQTAVVLPALASDPFGGTSLDEAETIEMLEAAAEAVQPGVIVIDTLTFSTSADLCSQTGVAGLRDRLVGLAQRSGAAVILSCHVNREGVILGRRIRGLARAVINMEEPDQDQPGRLRLWVSKSFSSKPLHLGVTLGPTGNTYDSNPPSKPDEGGGGKGGRPPASREKAIRFIVDRLTSSNDQRLTALRDAWVESGGSNGSFYDARNNLVESGRVIQEGKPFLLHLVADVDPEPGSF